MSCCTRYPFLNCVSWIIFREKKIDFFYSVSLRITLFHGVFGQRYWSYFTFDARSYFPLWKRTPKFSIGIISTDIWMNLLRLRKLNHYRDLAHRLRCERIWPWHEVSKWAKKASPEKAELESELQLVKGPKTWPVYSQAPTLS